MTHFELLKKMYLFLFLRSIKIRSLNLIAGSEKEIKKFIYGPNYCPLSTLTPYNMFANIKLWQHKRSYIDLMYYIYIVLDLLFDIILYIHIIFFSHVYNNNLSRYTWYILCKYNIMYYVCSRYTFHILLNSRVYELFYF